MGLLGLQTVREKTSGLAQGQYLEYCTFSHQDFLRNHILGFTQPQLVRTKRVVVSRQGRTAVTLTHYLSKDCAESTNDAQSISLKQCECNCTSLINQGNEWVWGRAPTLSVAIRLTGSMQVVPLQSTIIATLPQFPITLCKPKQ